MHEMHLSVAGFDAEKATHILINQKSTKSLQRGDIPDCRASNFAGLLRPGIVWFIESIPQVLLSSVHAWINPSDLPKTIDIMLVIRTNALVYPATAYIEAVRRKGARMAAIDIEKEDPSLLGLEEQDWCFQGDAATLVPEILSPLVGGSSSIFYENSA
jgi:NAD-dependent SIR2 family protein deacetylase